MAFDVAKCMIRTPDWPICRFRVSDRSAKCGYKIRNRYADVICDEDTCPIVEVQV